MHADGRTHAANPRFSYIRKQLVQMLLQYRRVLGTDCVTDTNFDRSGRSSTRNVTGEFLNPVCTAEEETTQSEFALVSRIDDGRKTQHVSYGLDPGRQASAPYRVSQILKNYVAGCLWYLGLNSSDSTVDVKTGLRTFGGENRKLTLPHRPVARVDDVDLAASISA